MKKRIRNAMLGMFLLMAPVLVAAYVSAVYGGDSLNREDLLLIAIAVGVLSAIGFGMNQYLKPQIEIVDATNSGASIEVVHKVEWLIANFSEMQQAIDEIKKYKPIQLDEKNTADLVNRIIEKIDQLSASEQIERQNQILHKILKEQEAESIERRQHAITKRLNAEISGLEARGRLNLIIGSLSALIGILVFLVLIGLDPPTVQTTSSSYLINTFFPRISLILVIELFAYFFLGLYRSGLAEIKYFNNELTNIEMKFFAYECAHMLSDDESKKKIISIMGRTERNPAKQVSPSLSGTDIKISQKNYDRLGESLTAILEKVSREQKG